MSAKQVLDLAEKQGLFDAKVIAELRRKMAESKFVVTPEAIAKILVDHGHLTPFQARKLVATALGPQDEPAPAPQTADDDEEIVMLDPVEPVAEAPPTPRKQSRPETLAPPAATPPRPAQDDIFELDMGDGPAKVPEPRPAVPPPQPAAKRSKRPKEGKAPRDSKPSAAEVEAIDLTSGLSPLPSDLEANGLSPFDDLLAPPLPGDPLAAADPLQSGLMPQAPRKKVRSNQWDSPLLLVGGGLLGAIVLAFVLLFYALTRGTAAEMFSKAEEDYRAGSYTSAMSTYETFLKKYPKDPQASLARVRRGMSQLRQVTDGGKDPKQGLNVAKRVLPEIEIEPEFDQARLELVSILPDITDGFADQAKQTGDTARREELVKLAEESLALVNNPSYLPSSRRKEAENRIIAILDKLKAARRSIDQDNDLQAAVTKIGASLAATKTAEAYQLRTALLRTYPGLESHPDITRVTLDISSKERELVEVAPFEAAAVRDDDPKTSTRIILASREGGEAAGNDGKIGYALIEGAVFAIEVKSGKVLWRRHVGFETTIHPLAFDSQAGADALVVDARTNEVMRLSAQNGALVWRQTLSEPPLSPLVAGDAVFVTSPAGQITKLDAATGNALARATLPQKANASPCYDAKRNRLYQLGEHSTLFALNNETLKCEETFYLGHKAGAILVPPVAVLDTVLVAESPADDHTLIHVLAPRGEKRLLTEVTKPFRLTGRIVLPLSVSGRRVAAVTDLGQVAVYEVDPTNPEKPILQAGSFAATEKTPFFSHYVTTGSELWVAGRRCTKYEIQASLQQLTRRWTLHQDDAFVAPLQIFGEVLLHVRRRPGSSAVIVEGCRASDGKAIWTNQLGASLVALAVSEARQEIVAITSQARVFEIPRSAIGTGYFDQPAYVPLPGQAPTALTTAVDLGNGRLVCTGFQGGGPALLYESSAATNRARPLMIAEAAGAEGAPPVAFRQGLLVPLVTGQVALFDPLQGTSLLLPFQPQLAVGTKVEWKRPAVLPGDGTSFVIGDGRQMVYRVGVQDQPRPHLAALAEAPLEGELISPLAASVDTVYGVARGATSDTVLSLDSGDLAAGMKWPLQGRWQRGPDEAAGVVFVAAEPDGLLCFEGGQKLRWTAPLKYGPLAGPPVPCDGDFILLTQGGTVVRIAADSGAEVAAVDLGEPLGKAAFVMGTTILVAGYDGVLHIIPAPKRS